MPPSANILRTIEDICAEDEAKMQQSFNDFDKCSAISIVDRSIIFHHIRKLLFAKTNVFFCLNFTEKEDECETASEIYQCGRDANLPIMNQIYTAEKGNATVVCFFAKQKLSSGLILF
jgi:hypothetical protein